eukprot:scaffold31545_cov69-Phaeocystis_antarctica.AAC.7
MASRGQALTEQFAAQTAATLVIDKVHGDVRAAPSAVGERWWSEMSALRLSAAALQSALYTPLSCGASDLPVDPDLPLLTPDTASQWLLSAAAMLSNRGALAVAPLSVVEDGVCSSLCPQHARLAHSLGSDAGTPLDSSARLLSSAVRLGGEIGPALGRCLGWLHASYAACDAPKAQADAAFVACLHAAPFSPATLATLPAVGSDSVRLTDWLLEVITSYTLAEGSGGSFGLGDGGGSGGGGGLGG